MDTESVVHLCCEEGESGTEAGSEDGVGGEHRGGEDGVGVYEVILFRALDIRLKMEGGTYHDGEEDEDHTESERNARCNGGCPREGRRVRPCEPEESDGECHSTNHGWLQSSFWGSEAAFIIDDFLVTGIVERAGI